MDRCRTRADAVLVSVVIKEHRAQEQERRGDRPGLWSRRRWIGHREAALPAAVSSEHLGEPEVEERCGFEDASCDARRLLTNP